MIDGSDDFDNLMVEAVKTTRGTSSYCICQRCDACRRHILTETVNWMNRSLYNPELTIEERLAVARVLIVYAKGEFL